MMSLTLKCLKQNNRYGHPLSLIGTKEIFVVLISIVIQEFWNQIDLSDIHYTHRNLLTDSSSML